MMVFFDFLFKETISSEYIISRMDDFDICYGRIEKQVWQGEVESVRIISKKPIGYVYFDNYNGKKISIIPSYCNYGLFFLRFISILSSFGIENGGYYFSTSFRDEDRKEPIFVNNDDVFVNEVFPELEDIIPELEDIVLRQKRKLKLLQMCFKYSNLNYVDAIQHKEIIELQSQFEFSLNPDFDLLNPLDPFNGVICNNSNR